MKLNLFKRSLAAVLASVALIGIFAGNTYANAAAKPKVAMLEASKDADHIILICGHRNNKTVATVNDYTKDSSGNWTKNWAVRGVVGANGISADKKEGDKKTPEGVFKATMNFGLKDNPGTKEGSKLVYHKIVPGDFWVDDSESKFYNQLVNTSTVTKDWNSAEDMMAASPYYNYGVALNYNTEAVPYKGSAIFIHATKTANDTYSSGCVRIPEEYMVKILNTLDENTKIVIIENESKLNSY